MYGKEAMSKVRVIGWLAVGWLAAIEKHGQAS